MSTKSPECESYLMFSPDPSRWRGLGRGLKNIERDGLMPLLIRRTDIDFDHALTLDSGQMVVARAISS